MSPNRAARNAALGIGGLFVMLGLAVVATGLGTSGPAAKAPAVILVAAGLAFLGAGLSVALNALPSNATISTLQLCLGLASMAALATVAVWALLAPGDSTSSVTFLFWKFSL